MPEPEVEYAVRAEHGEIIPRPSLAAAQRTVDGIRGHGGVAVLVSRTVQRSDWAEGLAPADGPTVMVPENGYDLLVRTAKHVVQYGFAGSAQYAADALRAAGESVPDPLPPGKTTEAGR